MSWNISQELPEGQYDSIGFTFGLNEADNLTFNYVNPPESFMFWPDTLGGGYHYLKLNGKWKNDTMLTNRPYEFHLGIGQIYQGDSVNGAILDYVQNYFEVSLPQSSFQYNDNNTLNLNIIMNIENWFQNPNEYNLSDYSENIMQDQEAISKACENGRMDVFNVLIDP